jgi:hypothetical protein
MGYRHDSELGDWRRRAQRGSRDIAVAVTLTVLAVGLLGAAWLGKASRQQADPIASAADRPPLR